MILPERGFLPNFCANRTVFLTVLVVELLAFVLALADTHAWDEFWPQLALKSLFMQWVALGIAAVLCRSRRRLAKLTTPATTLAAFGIAQIITLLCSLPALWLAASAGLGPDLTEQWPVIVRNQAISGIITLLALRYFYVQHQWQQQIEAEARARLQALQARIHPHFLFNTLNAIAGLISGRPEQAEQAVLDLADLLRSALADRASVPLAEELELTRRYLAIETLRMGERLTVDWRLDDDLPLDAPLPPLLLQPLVENAIRHGIQRLPEGGTLGIRVEKRTRELRFTIINPQPLDQELSKAGQQIAQDNVRQRLQLAYETIDPLAIVVAPEHYQVSFAIPLARP
ncbi:MAG: histidine kinase [Candidatus Contendobacter sp.]|nr:histidine kinase [Gammaproteobacteria bacterium]MCC8993960.1 histidine kinase [Candidatus Contendobacter sp.]